MASKKSGEALALFFEYGLNIKTRTIHIQHEIDTNSVMDVIKAIDLLILEKYNEPIHIYINSFGGDPYSAFALYDYIKNCIDAPIITHCIGSAMSAAATIFCAGDVRIMYPNSTLMLHSVSSGTEGKLYPNLVNETEECKNIHKKMCQIYAEVTEKPLTYWTQHLKYEDRYYTPKEALKIKLITDVLDVKQELSTKKRTI